MDLAMTNPDNARGRQGHQEPINIDGPSEQWKDTGPPKTDLVPDSTENLRKHQDVQAHTMGIS
jgi:hypothetical protein